MGLKKPAKYREISGLEITVVPEAFVSGCCELLRSCTSDDVLQDICVRVISKIDSLHEPERIEELEKRFREMPKRFSDEPDKQKSQEQEKSARPQKKAQQRI